MHTEKVLAAPLIQEWTDDRRQATLNLVQRLPLDHDGGVVLCHDSPLIEEGWKTRLVDNTEGHAALGWREVPNEVFILCESLPRTTRADDNLTAGSDLPDALCQIPSSISAEPRNSLHIDTQRAIDQGIVCHTGGEHVIDQVDTPTVSSKQLGYSQLGRSGEISPSSSGELPSQDTWIGGHCCL